MTNGICDLCGDIYSSCICAPRPPGGPVAELHAEVERLTRERDEARAEIERLTRERDAQDRTIRDSSGCPTGDVCVEFRPDSAGLFCTACSHHQGCHRETP